MCTEKDLDNNLAVVLEPHEDIVKDVKLLSYELTKVRNATTEMGETFQQTAKVFRDIEKKRDDDRKEINKISHGNAQLCSGNVNYLLGRVKTISDKIEKREKGTDYTLESLRNEVK